jgi:bifunctional UDP-N-acetylglucosamine pyrophosphorylase/glucosamine-1-phosphate N-acetyltransferase
VQGINDRAQLGNTAREYNRRILEYWMREGVTIVDPDTTTIEADVTIAADVEIQPGTQLRGATSIGEDAVIGPDTTLVDTEVGAGAVVKRTDATLAVIGAGATVGPWSYLRPNTVIGAGAKVGTFVETKNSTLGDGAKVPHLSYVGDAEIGDGAYSGAGTSIRKDVPAGALALNVAPQRNIEGWVAKHRPGTPAADAAAAAGTASEVPTESE